MALQFLGSLFISSLLWGVHSSPDGPALIPSTSKTLLQKSRQQGESDADIANALTLEEMFANIWIKYSQGKGLVSLQQLNQLLRDTDQERGDQVIDDAWWQSLCKKNGADPNEGLSSHSLMSFYFNDQGNSIRRDYVRIFAEGTPPPPDQRKNLLRKNARMEEAEMFDEIWAKYSQDDLLNQQGLNSLLRDTDQEKGKQVVDSSWWQELCKTKGVDPKKGLSKRHLVEYYFDIPGSSIKRDYVRIFVEGAAPSHATPQGHYAELIVSV